MFMNKNYHQHKECMDTLVSISTSRDSVQWSQRLYYTDGALGKHNLRHA